MSTLPPGQPLTLQLLLDEATKQARRHFRAIYLAVAIPVGVASGVMPIAQAVFFKDMSLVARTTNFAAMLPAMGFFVVAALFFVFIYALAHGATLAATVDAVAGRGVSMKRAWLTMLRPRVLGTLLLSGIAAFLGFILCVLPGIYLGLLFCLVIPVVVDEGLAGPSALGRSRELMRYNPKGDLGSDPRLKAFLILFVGALLGYAVNFVVELPAMVVQQVVVFRGVAGGQRMDPASLMTSLMWLHVPTGVLAALGQMVVQLYVSFCIALLFFDLRRRKEGLDLERAIDSLTAPAEPGR